MFRPAVLAFCILIPTGVACAQTTPTVLGRAYGRVSGLYYNPDFETSWFISDGPTSQYATADFTHSGPWPDVFGSLPRAIYGVGCVRVTFAGTMRGPRLGSRGENHYDLAIDTIVAARPVAEEECFKAVERFLPEIRSIAMQARGGNDSAGIGAAIAARIVDQPHRDSSWRLVIDTTNNRWNAFARRALYARAPSRLPVLSDSVAYYESHFTVESVSVTDALVVVAVRYELCYTQESRAYGKEKWYFQRTSTGWGIALPPAAPRDAVTTGHGTCEPYKRKPAQ